MNKKVVMALSAVLSAAIVIPMAACGGNTGGKKFDPNWTDVPYQTKNTASDEETKILNDLSALIEQGRTSLDSAVRKPIYSQALDKVMELAIELPVYQRKNLFIYDKTVIDESTLITGSDVTPYQSPIAKIWEVDFTDAYKSSHANNALVLSSLEMDGLFNPFFYTSGYDSDVINMTQLAMLNNDKNGDIVAYAKNDKEGVTVASKFEMVMRNAQGNVVTDSAQAATTDYIFTVRDDLKFSDGTSVTMDDVLFNYYMYLDPAYTGSTTMYTLPIVGLQKYRTQLDDEDYAKYEKIVASIFAAGKGDGYKETTAFTEAQYNLYWQTFDENGALFAQSIVDYCKGYIDLAAAENVTYAEAVLGVTPAELKASEGLQVAFGMAMWGFGDFKEDGKFYGADGEHSWTLEDDDLPTAADYFAVMEAAYEYDYADLYATEAADDSRDFVSDTKEAAIRALGAAAGDAHVTKTVEGIKADGNTLTVTIEGIDPVAIYQLSPTIAPKAYYTSGWTYQADDENFVFNANGVQFNDSAFIQHVRQIVVPVGAGPFVATNASGANNPAYADFFSNGIVYFKANPSFALGTPKLSLLRFQTVVEDQKYDSVKKGELHYAAPQATSETIGNLTGKDKDQLGYQLVDNLGYGYIGLNARFVNELEARRAIMYAMDRSLVLDYYTGGLAEIIERSMSKVNWAYPEGAKAYYPFDGTGVKSFELLRDLGYQVKNPDTDLWYNKNGPTLKLTFSVAGSSLEAHPAAQTMVKAAEILNNIGCDITVVADNDALSKLTTSGELAVWCAAWQATIDPDMYQVYHKDSQATSVLAWGYDYLLGKVGTLASWATKTEN